MVCSAHIAICGILLVILTHERFYAWLALSYEAVVLIHFPPSPISLPTFTHLTTFTFLSMAYNYNTTRELFEKLKLVKKVKGRFCPQRCIMRWAHVLTLLVLQLWLICQMGWRKVKCFEPTMCEHYTSLCVPQNSCKHKVYSVMIKESQSSDTVNGDLYGYAGITRLAYCERTKQVREVQNHTHVDLSCCRR